MNELLDEYKKSLKSAWGYNDYNDWPIKFNSIMHLFMEEFFDSFIKDYDTCKIRGVSLDNIGKAFGNPARLYRMINGLIFGMKKKGIPIQMQRALVIELLRATQALKFGSVFNEDGKNIVLCPHKIALLMKEIKFHKADVSEAKILQRICGLLWSYTEAIFFRAHDITKEFHGLYSLPDKNERLMIREYLNLNPQDLWPDVELLPYKNIQIYCLYKNNLEVTIDAYNHLFLNNGNYVDDLVGYYILCDGKETDIQELSLLVPQVLNAVHNIQHWVKKTTWIEHTKKYADIYWYRKKPLCALANTTAQVPEIVYEKIENGQVDIRRLKNLTDRQIDWLISTII